jgi:hypothetical protein
MVFEMTMKWTLILFSLFVLNLTAQASEWVDVWQASPDVWESQKAQGFSPSDFEVLKTSRLSRAAQEKRLRLCEKKIASSKRFYVGDRYGNNYQVSEVSESRQAQDDCVGRVGETACAKSQTKKRINDCLRDFSPAF